MTLPPLPALPQRLGLLALVGLLPFTGFLVSQRYPFARAEVAATLALFLLWALALAAIARHRALFLALFTLAAAALGAVPLARMAALPGSPWLAFAALLVTLTAAALALGAPFYRLAAIFACATFGAHLAVEAAQRAAAAPPPHTRPAAPPAHTLYLILDEHLGIDGFPAAIPECVETRDQIRRLYLDYGFDLHSRAFANYPVTLDSVPSILNGRLARRRYEFIDGHGPDRYGIHHIDARGFFTGFRRRGLDIHLSATPFLHYETGGPATSSDITDGLAPLDHAPLPWLAKASLLLGRYQSADPIRGAFRGLLPFRAGDRPLTSLAAGDSWEQRLAADIAAAPRPTLFFAHLLLPHYPFVYRRDGTIRPLEEWDDDHNNLRLSPAAYAARYRRYAGQAAFLAARLRWLFATLDRAGLLAPMTVIVHGDHGSRIRLARPGLPSGRLLDQYDYPAAPDPADLADRFSALLAVKAPYAAPGGREQPAPISILAGVSQALARPATPAPSLFLYDGPEAVHPIPSEILWK